MNKIKTTLLYLTPEIVVNFTGPVAGLTVNLNLQHKVLYRKLPFNHEITVPCRLGDATASLVLLFTREEELEFISIEPSFTDSVKEVLELGGKETTIKAIVNGKH